MSEIDGISADRWLGYDTLCFFSWALSGRVAVAPYLLDARDVRLFMGLFLSPPTLAQRALEETRQVRVGAVALVAH